MRLQEGLLKCMRARLYFRIEGCSFLDTGGPVAVGPPHIGWQLYSDVFVTIESDLLPYRVSQLGPTPEIEVQ